VAAHSVICDGCILKKGVMQLYVSLLVFSTTLSLPESAYLSEIVIRVHVIKTYPSLCDKTSLKRHCLFYACIKSV
jgi:hypothetical protein